MEIIEKLNLPQIPLYTYDIQTKQVFFLEHILELFEHHCNNSVAFNRMMTSVNYQKQNIHSIEDLPFIPVRLFKLFELGANVPVDKLIWGQLIDLHNYKKMSFNLFYPILRFI